MPGIDSAVLMDDAIRLLQSGDGEAAATRLRAILDSDPDDMVAQANYGVALQLQQRYDDAEAIYRQVAARTPARSEAYYNLGSVLLAQGRPDEAATMVQRAVAIDGRNPARHKPPARAPLAANAPTHGASPVDMLLQQGLLLLHQGFADKAIDCFHRVLALDPANGPAAWIAGEECYWRGRIVEAQRDLAVGLRWLRSSWRPVAAPPQKRFDKQAARTVLFAALDALDAAGIAWFLNGGTALGCVREGDFISFDSDVDIGAMPGTDPAAVIDAIAAQPGIDYLYHDTHKDAVLRVRFGAPDSVGGDVFLYQDTPDGLWCGVQRGPYALRWRDTKFARIQTDFLGRLVWLPDPVERYLEENYGPGWRVPDPDHVPGFSAPNLIEPSSPLTRCAIYGAIGSALARGDRGKAERHCAAAVSRFPEDVTLRETLSQLRSREP